MTIVAMTNSMTIVAMTNNMTILAMTNNMTMLSNHGLRQFDRRASRPWGLRSTRDGVGLGASTTAKKCIRVIQQQSFTM